MKFFHVILIGISATVLSCREIKKTCKEEVIGINAINARWDGSSFTYNITFCSQPFTAATRKIKFWVTLADDQYIFETTESYSDVQKGKLHGSHSHSVAVHKKPHNFSIAVYYKDSSATNPNPRWKNVYEGMKMYLLPQEFEEGKKLVLKLS